MLQFLQQKSVKRYVNFKGDEPVAIFLDKTDALFYSQYYPLYGLEEVDCAILHDCGYEDECDHELCAVRILLKKTPTEQDARTQVELWCCDGLEEALLYAYARHVAFGGSKENFDATLTSVNLFHFEDDYDGSAKQIHSTPFLTEILSHVNANNYPLALSLLELCLLTNTQSIEDLKKAEQDSFTFSGQYVEDAEEQIKIIQPKAYYYLAYDLFTDYGFRADGLYKKLYEEATTIQDKKKALILLFVIRNYTLCFPTLAYEMVISEEKIPHPTQA